MSSRLRWFGAFAALWLAVTAGAAQAHPLDEGVSIALMRVSTAAEADGALVLSLVIVNNGGAAVTLRDLRAPGYAVDFERKRSLFGVEAWATVDFLRLEPGRSVILDLPDYRLLAWPEAADAPGADEVVVYADFGPIGVISTLDDPLARLGAPQLAPGFEP